MFGDRDVTAIDNGVRTGNGGVTIGDMKVTGPE